MNKSLNTINPRCYNGRVQIRYHHQDQNEDATVKYGRYNLHEAFEGYVRKRNAEHFSVIYRRQPI